MTAYYVHVYETYRSKFEVEANSMEEACELAEEMDNPIDREPAEEVLGFLVDVVGDDEYRQTKNFNANYVNMNEDDLSSGDKLIVEMEGPEGLL